MMSEQFNVFDYVDINDVVRLRVDDLVDDAQRVEEEELVDHCEWMSISIADTPRVGTQDYDMVRLLIMCAAVGLAPALDNLNTHFLNVPHINYEELTFENDLVPCSICEQKTFVWDHCARCGTMATLEDM